ncbi:MAG: hypothetical protein E7049_09130 [Lentisphaerae bacterium]|jgi:uncharacterized membrane protein YccF (DUF307 family)|nr:hypothetical protein [Lentisphaerota bacterium]
MKRILSNFIVWALWFVFGGFVSTLTWLFFGIFFMLTVVGFSRGVACLRLAWYALCPMGKRLVIVPESSKPGGALKFLWLIVLGMWPFGVHLVIGTCWVFSLFGLPLADRFFELASVSFNPRRVKGVRRNKYADARVPKDVEEEYEAWKGSFKGRIFALPYMNCRATSFKHVWHTLGDFKPMDSRAMMFTHTYYETAKELVETYGIKDGDIVIGTCLGGMIVQEMVRLRKLKAMVLVASPRSRNDYYRMYHYIKPLVLALSDRGLKWIFGTSPAVPPRITNLINGEKGAQNVRRFIIQALGWHGVRINIPMCRIHGDVDFLFPVPSKCDYVLRGGHFIGIVNSDECVASIKKFIVEKHREGVL